MQFLEICSFHLGATSWARAAFVFVVACKTDVLYTLALTKESSTFTISSHPSHGTSSNDQRKDYEES
jgi:hypothetical protein